MIPESSKLNWSYEKPTFEEVEAKTVLVEWKVDENRSELEIGSFEIISSGYYKVAFRGFVRYAILDLDAPLEPKPLWGVKPTIREPQEERWYQTTRVIVPAFPYWVIQIEVNEASIIMKNKDKAKLILAWNNLVDVIEKGEKNG